MKMMMVMIAMMIMMMMTIWLKISGLIFTGCAPISIVIIREDATSNAKGTGHCLSIV